ncbi:Oidioi.mRNA.OKI2018_I69.PAR.g11438.t1.cds [Oikopleura dioica]|uniref:Oidioi.mRNA.OKI2018_I69.PAR.g11438.t1.cds n=1 Tax=Oikopleura dioica TaxID=34765 RepID=A0ABN7RYR8_OIKDI|nr:Oidioi.mRNA.OKI2018_I69.PAR.g11438.t1.cds [Oikopleura dioica]
MSDLSDSESFTSSSYTSYSDSLTYSDGSLTDSSDFDLLLATPQRTSQNRPEAQAKTTEEEKMKNQSSALVKTSTLE